jgi:anti-sigma-K factor RskA
MTDHDEMYDVHALSGAYAVDALDEAERARFEEHLRSCAECRAEVDSLRETAAALGTDDVEPPAGLRDQILAGIETVRPLPPLMSQGPESGAGGDELAARRRRWFRMPMLVAAAAVVILIAAGATVWLGSWSDESGPAPGPTATEQVLAADDANRTTLEFEDGSQATVVVSRSVDHAVIVTEDMAPAPPGKDYQLWFQNTEGEMEPAGLMPDDSDATVLLDGQVGAHTGVGITVEPDGGSPEPSTDPIAVFAFDG